MKTPRICGAVLLATAILTTSTLAMDRTTVKLATLAPDGSVWHQSLRQMGEALGQGVQEFSEALEEGVAEMKRALREALEELEQELE